MLRSSGFRFLLSVGLVFGLVQVSGCAHTAGPPTTEGAAVEQEAPGSAVEEGEAAAPAVALLEQAERAYEQEDYERASDLFDQALQSPEGLSDEQLVRARHGRGRAESILHQRRLAEEEEVREEAVRAEAAEAEPDVSGPEAAETAPESAEAEPPEAESEAAESEAAETEVPEAEAAGAEPDAAEAEAVEPEQARQTALELKERIESLKEEGKLDEAAAHFEALDALRLHLLPDQRAPYDLFRAEFQAMTGQLRPLSEEEKEARAREDFEAGVAAYEEDDFVSAELCLNAVASFDTSLGWWKNRTLRKLREEVSRTLDQARGNYAEARALLEAGSPEEARRVLEGIQEQGVDIGRGEELAQLLAAAEEGIAEQERQAEEQRRQEAERRAQERRAQAAELLGQAREQVAQEAYEEAAGLLVQISEMQESLSPEQVQQHEELLVAVEKATGLTPGASAAQRAAKAEEYFELGLQAYEKGDYAQADELLGKAAALEVDLGWLDNRKLRRVSEEVAGVLSRLRAELAEGKALMEEGRLQEAKDVLAAVRESGISIGRDEEIDELIASLDQRIGERQHQQEEELRQQAARLLEMARGLRAEGRYEEAADALATLAQSASYLSPEHQAEAEALRRLVGEAAAAAEVHREMQAAEELASQAAELVAVQRSVLAKVGAAEEAFQQGDVVAAEALLKEAKERLQELDVSVLPALAEVGVRVAQRLEAVRQEIERRARLAEIGARLEEMFAEAGHLLGEDLLAAERKVVDATGLAEREGVALTSGQLQVRTAVLAAVEERYGVQRRLRPVEFATLLERGDQYRARGEYRKAEQLLALLAAAPAGMISGADLAAAEQQQAAISQQAAQRAEEARRMVSLFAQAGAELDRGQLEAARQRVAAVVEMARQEGLAGPQMAEVLRKGVAFLEEDFRQALQKAFPPLEQIVQERLAMARAALAGGLSESYIRNGAPELAEPYLRTLAESGDPQAAEWAEAQLA
ncbi:MAG: coiled-coil domain-containing protein, partial [Planctomycetota bacterium]